MGVKALERWRPPRLPLWSGVVGRPQSSVSSSRIGEISVLMDHTKLSVVSPSNDHLGLEPKIMLVISFVSICLVHVSKWQDEMQ